MTQHPEPIMAESFRRIEAEVGPHRFSAREWPIVRRIIHASGDLELAGQIRIENDPVSAALKALVSKTPIITDVTMVLAGLHKPSLERLGTTARCFLNETGVEERAQKTGMTRSACGFELAMTSLKTDIYVVGNAPTALLALCAAVREKRVQPALVVAMPVGFVAVSESKEEARKLGVPVITILGRKGGSAVAATTVNALLALALEENCS